MEAVTFDRTKMMGIVYLRSLSFYKIKQDILQEHLGRHYHFKLADNVCHQYNRFINLMRKEEENSEGKFPWLEDTDEEKIYDGQRDTRQVCESGQLLPRPRLEKTQVRDLLFKYKDAFSLKR